MSIERTATARRSPHAASKSVFLVVGAFVVGFGLTVGIVHLFGSRDVPAPAPNKAVAAAPSIARSGLEPIVLGHGAGRYAADDAEDWTAHADHVVAVTVISDRERPPAAVDVDRGEGLILRDLDLRVDSVLWSSDAAPIPAPKSLEWTAFGWMFKGSPITGRIEMGAEGAPRLERGHAYVIAIDWVPSTCSGGGRWEGLSGQSMIPFDGGQLGTGEFEGHALTAAEMATVDSGERTLREQVAGDTAASLTADLNSADGAVSTDGTCD